MDLHRMLVDIVADAVAETEARLPDRVGENTPILYGNLGGTNDGGSPGHRPEYQPIYKREGNRLSIVLPAPYAHRQDTDAAMGNLGYSLRILDAVGDDLEQEIHRQTRGRT